MKNVRELRDARGNAAAKGREILDNAEKEKRQLNAEEKVSWEACMADVKNIGAEIEVEERQASVDLEMATAGIAKVGDNRANADGDPLAEKRMAAFRKAITHGELRLSDEERRLLCGSEYRGLTAGDDASAGFLNAPMDFVQQLIVKVKNLVFIRDMATIFQLKSNMSMGAPSLETDVDDPDWTPEVKTVVEDAGLAFGRRELTPHPLSKLVKISNKLLRTAAMSPEAIVMDRIVYKFGVAMEKAYLVGTGAEEPLGVFVASDLGIPASRDVATGNSATALTFDGLINAKYSLKAQHQDKAVWLFNRDAVSMIAKLKDGDGQYIWQPSVIAGQQDMILGRPLKMSEYVPNTFTTGLYVGMFADFSYYWIADSLSMQFQRLNELFSLNNQIGFIGRLETDGMPTLSEAFARITLA